MRLLVFIAGEIRTVAGVGATVLFHCCETDGPDPDNSARGRTFGVYEQIGFGGIVS